jgi:outer membrane biosynthesis protein TonB
VAHVASLEDLARSDTGSVDVAAATAMLVALAEAPEAEQPVGKRAHKFSMPARAPKPVKAPKAEKAPKPVKAEKAPKAENAPKGEKAPKPEKALKPPKQAKGDRLRLVDRVLEKLESVDSFLTDVNAGKRSVGGKK